MQRECTKLDFNAVQYGRCSRIQKEWGGDVLAGLRLSGRERVLDLGCGDGRLTADIAHRVPQGSVLGIDSSPAMLAAAERLSGRNLSFRQVEIDDLAFDEEFDLVFSNAALHWVTDHERLIANVFAALRPGGVVRWSFAGDGNSPTLLRVLRETMQSPEFAPAFVGFQWPWVMPTADEYQGLLAAQPFQEAHAWIQPADKYFESPFELTGWIEQPCLVPFLAQLDEEQRPAFRDEVVWEMISRTLQADGRCFERFRRLSVLARK